MVDEENNRLVIFRAQFPGLDPGRTQLLKAVVWGTLLMVLLTWNLSETKIIIE